MYSIVELFSLFLFIMVFASLCGSAKLSTVFSKLITLYKLRYICLSSVVCNCVNCLPDSFSPLMFISGRRNPRHVKK